MGHRPYKEELDKHMGEWRDFIIGGTKCRILVNANSRVILRGDKNKKDRIQALKDMNAYKDR